ncbi:uroporphyrinogen-III C-methyltransferase [Alloyangia pacifica]|uniref:uroporphyrinogen-III C-methyltransferase n=1 Tax=Alloyangia pacifica TaxID=311180 RepID=A0A2U8H9J8_9RHOB|nr:uroporphyrinogen-III C-methyltransferase [Alloyangia pacifica]AWI82423.1 uroporphyrinogen-III C-methyltransferase [Alloyangia pacifica]
MSVLPSFPIAAPDEMPAKGTIALVGAGPGAADLLTLRAVARLQAADVIFYDRLVDPDVLALAGPRAELVFVGKEVGAHAWPQEQINAVIVAAALRGRNVVRLKSGDPGIFGRAAEELEAARMHGIETEIVPGVTAAMAAAARAGIPLTTRGETDALVLATGHARAGDPLPDCARHARPGVALALYMAVSQAERITRSLLETGMPEDAPLTIAVEVSKPGERIITGRLVDLPALLVQHGVTGCAAILASWPKMAKAGVCEGATGKALA